MELKLVTIDLDETLLRTDKTYDVDRFNKVLEKLNEQGIIVAVVTGNSYHKIHDYFTAEVLAKLYFACDNGNYIVKDGTPIKKTGIPYQDFTQIIDFIDEFDGYYPCLSLGDASYFRKKSGPAFDFVARYNNDLQYIPLFSELPEDSVVTKIAIATEDSLDKNKVLARIINERYENVTAVTSGDGWVDVYNRQGGKGSALAYLQDKYQIKAEESMAFGDSLNDESMMSQVYYSIAMENADVDLEMQCRFKIGTNNDQAVLGVLERYIQKGNLDFLNDKRTIKQ
ncbi:HAD family phosphatase [Facklamia sp. DSM 111018]|uniref:HAD family phosphatase n=1 Tax=Facklamia lactis TaxID=2749967 RepID=A0ABS0LQL5_9LACT|nr:HAD family hydrolase [Facklamia lactis]MBG9980497.1 HAD family phosphatase [Facklamia lactis]MBG9986289.1 HAD family phosphatase [Facklamia lactis]